MLEKVCALVIGIWGRIVDFFEVNEEWKNGD